MRSVRISWKTAQRCLGALEAQTDGSSDAAWEEIRRAMKPKKSVSASRKRRETKRASKRDETAAIREAVRARSGGGCELCLGLGTELHHALGRRVQQSAHNCLWLCRNCHHGITNNRPGAAHWLDEQRRRFHALGCSETSDILHRRLKFVEARGAT